MTCRPSTTIASHGRDEPSNFSRSGVHKVCAAAEGLEAHFAEADATSAKRERSLRSASRSSVRRRSAGRSRSGDRRCAPRPPAPIGRSSTTKRPRRPSWNPLTAPPAYRDRSGLDARAESHDDPHRGLKGGLIEEGRFVCFLPGVMAEVVCGLRARRPTPKSRQPESPRKGKDYA